MPPPPLNYFINTSSISIPFNPTLVDNPSLAAGVTPMTTYYIEVGTSFDSSGNLILTTLAKSTEGSRPAERSKRFLHDVYGLTPGSSYFMRFTPRVTTTIIHTA